MPTKITFFYHTNLAGYSESHYDSVNGPAAVTLANLANYVNARMDISGMQVTLDYIRLSTVGTARQVKIYAPTDLPAGTNTTGQFNTGPRSRQDADFSATSALVRKLSGLNFSRFFLRGIPDIIVDGGGLYDPTVTNWADAWRRFTVALTGLSWSWKSNGPPLVAGGALITAAVANGDGTVSFTLGAPLFATLLVPPNKHYVVRISGQVAPRGLNGAYTVVIQSATTCRTLHPILFGNFQPNTGVMTATGAPGYQLITALQIERIVKRGPGRPFGLVRGRAKPKLLV